MIMLYKYPSSNALCDEKNGCVKVEGNDFDYLIVEDNIEVKGFYKTAAEALKSDNKGDNSSPTREELITKAKELGITFPRNIKDATLLKKIEDKLAE